MSEGDVWFFLFVFLDDCSIIGVFVFFEDRGRGIGGVGCVLVDFGIVIGWVGFVFELSFDEGLVVDVFCLVLFVYFWMDWLFIVIFFVKFGFLGSWRWFVVGDFVGG